MLSVLIVITALLICCSYSQCPNNCQVCILPSLCSVCTAGYALTRNGSCTARTISNCRVYQSPSACLICQSTFTLVNNRCEKDPTGCLSRRTDGKCQFCGFGTNLQSDNCQGILNCLEYGSGEQCSRCDIGYRLSSGKCIDNRTECALQNAAGQCNQCQKGYILNGFSCLLPAVIPPNCELYNFTGGYCLICNQGYQIQHRFCQRIDQISPLGVPNSPIQTFSALRMPVDILDGAVATASKQLGRDNLYPSDYRVQISSFGNRGTVSSNSCWLMGMDGQCKVCLEGHNLFEGKCVKLPPSCLKYSADNRTCLECIPALTLQKGQCVDINCAVGIFSRCMVCKQPIFTPNSEGICISPGCTQLIAGVCQSCQAGMTLSLAGACITSTSSTTQAQVPSSNTLPSASENNQPTIKHCLSAVRGNCVSCSDGYFPNGVGGCKRVVIGCLQMDASEENCIQCISIYKLDSTGGCLFPGQELTSSNNKSNSNSTITSNSIPSITPNSTLTITQNNTVANKSNPLPSSITPSEGSFVDPNCKIQNQGSCAVCQDRYTLNLYNFTCMPISKQCNAYNESNGQCLSCSTGFNLFSGWCLARMTAKDAACQISDINNYCIKCQNDYFSIRGTCQPNNPLCRTTQYRGGNCLSCYSGYILYNGNCIEISKQPACSSYNFQGICQQCINRFYLVAGVCNPVSPLCRNYDSTSGNCLSCIAGYGLSSTTSLCQKVKPVPENCSKADPTGKCQTCNPRFYLDDQQACRPASPLCQSFRPTGGSCLSCYSGFILLPDGSCLKSNLILGCRAANLSGDCTSCLPQYVEDGKGACLTRDPNCLNYTNGKCTNCSNMYFVSGGVCKKKTPKSKDPNCLINDLYNYCQQCTQGYYITEGNCNLVDQLCRTYDPSNGYCLSCYDGYRLSQTKCYLNNPIFNCQIFNGNVCVLCQKDYKLQPDGSCAI